MNEEHALANLLDAQKALTSLHARPFLTAGTLLGMVRERRFMAHDRDIDLGVFAEEMPTGEAIRDAMEARGFAYYKEHGTAAEGYELRFERHGIKTDIFAFYKDDRGRFHAAWKKGTPIRRSFPDFDLRLRLFYGVPMWVPADPIAHVRAKYGPDWRTPVTEWDWAWGPKNAEAWA